MDHGIEREIFTGLGRPAGLAHTTNSTGIIEGRHGLFSRILAKRKSHYTSRDSHEDEGRGSSVSRNYCNLLLEYNIP